MKKLLIFLFCLPSLSFSQWVDCSMSEYLTFVNKNRFFSSEKPGFYFECNYNFYENYDSPKPKLQYKSTFLQTKEGDFYMEQFGKICIQNSNMKLIFDSIEKKIVLAERDSLFQDPNLFDISKYNSNGSKTKIMKWVGNEMTKFYFELPVGHKFKATEVWLNQSGLLLKIIFYSATEVENGEEDSRMILPKLEIVYQNYHGLNELPEMSFIMSDFVIFQNGIVSLQDKYKGFDLIDLRRKI